MSGDREGLFSYFDAQELSAAIKIKENAGSSSRYNTEGWFSRAMYNLDEKYFLSASYRRDASSRFHPDHRWGNFYSFGGAWIASKEDWFKVSWIDMLKVKASWGQQGNDAIGDYRYTDTYTINYFQRRAFPGPQHRRQQEHHLGDQQQLQRRFGIRHIQKPRHR